MFHGKPSMAPEATNQAFIPPPNQGSQPLVEKYLSEAAQSAYEWC